MASDPLTTALVALLPTWISRESPGFYSRAHSGGPGWGLSPSLLCTRRSNSSDAPKRGHKQRGKGDTWTPAQSMPQREAAAVGTPAIFPAPNIKHLPGTGHFSRRGDTVVNRADKTPALTEPGGGREDTKKEENQREDVSQAASTAVKGSGKVRDVSYSQIRWTLAQMDSGGVDVLKWKIKHVRCPRKL